MKTFLKTPLLICLMAIFCCILCNCAGNRLQLSQLKDHPLTIAPCSSWADLLQQPEIVLSNQHRVRLGINTDCAANVGVIQLFCLEYIGPDQKINNYNLGPFQAYGNESRAVSMRDLSEQVFEIGTWHLYHCFIPTHQSKQISIDYDDNLIARYRYKTYYQNSSWFQPIGAISPIRDHALEAQIQHFESATLGPNEFDNPTCSAQSIAALKQQTFPILNKTSTKQLTCTALSKQRFELKIPDNDISPDLFEHLLLRFWVNDQPYTTVSFPEYGTTLAPKSSLLDHSEHPLQATLHLKNLPMDCAASDEVKIQFLFNHFQNSNGRASKRINQSPAPQTNYYLSDILLVQKSAPE